MRIVVGEGTMIVWNTVGKHRDEKEEVFRNPIPCSVGKKKIKPPVNSEKDPMSYWIIIE